MSRLTGVTFLLMVYLLGRKKTPAMAVQVREMPDADLPPFSLQREDVVDTM